MSMKEIGASLTFDQIQAGFDSCVQPMHVDVSIIMGSRSIRLEFENTNVFLALPDPDSGSVYISVNKGKGQPWTSHDSFACCYQVL